eukprot:CAMPEP_0119339946 /NCGR_PEP_ID=MMETSP1333-20130426/99371_1 /TAXON_ID=418940 /ORGANISM="Scyphosphaera apsteinii, Strain RCC1455" /LENGTH=148 /DNA_ID=CAMNT_0007351583 /DNA_START=158 /DNA_END=604 /DNA_ORIENTATION=-
MAVLDAPWVPTALSASTVASFSSNDAVRLVEDEAEYDALVAAAIEEDRLVVIKFFASWCRACKAMAPKYKKVAQVRSKNSTAEFYEIMFDNNKALCKKLRIKVLPYIQIVAGGEGIVDSFTCGPSKIALLSERLEKYIQSEGHPTESE